MSKFNKYIKQAEKAAKQAIEKYNAAEAVFQQATQKMNDTPMTRFPDDPVYQARATLVKHEWNERRAQFDAVRRNLPGEIEAELRKIRCELEADLTDSFAPTPEQIDSNALELLKSGVLRPNEYVRMADDAVNSGNYAMARMIGKYAGEALEAEVEKNGRSSVSVMLQQAVARSRQTGAEDYLDKFDALADMAQRCVKNPSMPAYWDRLMGDLIRDF